MLPPVLRRLAGFQQTVEGLRLGELVRSAHEDDPHHGLPAVVKLRAQVDRWELEQVARARADGWCWAEIGRILGVSRQAATKKFSGVADGTPPPAARSWSPGTYVYDDVSEAMSAGELTQAEAWHLIRALSSPGD
jgi:hypothetical protein